MSRYLFLFLELTTNIVLIVIDKVKNKNILFTPNVTKHLLYYDNHDNSYLFALNIYLY